MTSRKCWLFQHHWLDSGHMLCVSLRSFNIEFPLLSTYGMKLDRGVLADGHGTALMTGAPLRGTKVGEGALAVGQVTVMLFVCSQ